jgi:hypothetical protein
MNSQKDTNDIAVSLQEITNDIAVNSQEVTNDTAISPQEVSIASRNSSWKAGNGTSR